MSEESIYVDTLVTEDMTKKELFEYAKYLEHRKEALIDVAAKHLQNEILYKSRCEKAVEYLNSLTNYRFEFTFDGVDRHEIVGCEKNFVKDLLNILQGSDKE